VSDETVFGAPHKSLGGDGLSMWEAFVQEALEKSVTAKRVLRERKKGVESYATSLL